ncbi:MAG: hypothetical protein HY902_02180, partial [Deltaproteobacteria bacterium]|nr:hypothetical protein [Deltaproteobacteria bacterium]
MTTMANELPKQALRPQNPQRLAAAEPDEGPELPVEALSDLLAEGFDPADVP